MVGMGNEQKKTETAFQGIPVLCILSKALKNKILKNPLKYNIKYLLFTQSFSLIFCIPRKTFKFKSTYK